MDAAQKKIRVYSLTTCAVCKKVKKFLDENQKTYENVEVDILDGGEQWLATKELKKYNPQATYPTVVIEEVIQGFDEERLKAALSIP